MQNDRNTELVRNKMEALDTLSGGIVYGKEEAWEKLQQRMERKPAMRIAIKPLVAAAAVLLLLVTTFIVYQHPAKETTKATVRNSAPVVIVPTQPVELQPVDEAKSTVTRRGVPALVKHPERAISIVDDGSRPVVAETKKPMPTGNDALLFTANVPPTPVAVPVTPRKMRVVHINELNKEDEAQDMHQEVVVNNSAIDVSKLPRVHINEVIHEEYEVQRLLQENRLGTERQFFLWKNRMDAGSSRSEDDNTMYRARYRQKTQTTYQYSY
jgi:hypothetical protein